MTLIKSILKQGIKAAFLKQANKKSVNDDPLQSVEELAEDLSIVIDAYIKLGTVNTIVTGASATGGPVTAKGTGKIT